MALAALGMASCGSKTEEKTQESDFKWVVDTFDDIRVQQYKVPGFEDLTLQEKKLVYYLNQAALCGRDIMFDQNFRYNLVIRRTLEAMYTNHKGEKEGEEWMAFEKYLKKVWFANGIHHHYSNDKFKPGFSAGYFDELMAATPENALPLDFGTREEIIGIVRPAIFDPALYPTRLNQARGEDLLKTSSMNYYEGVTQKEAENFYARMGRKNDPRPVSYGLNSKLVRENGKIVEKVWRTGGMYSPAIEQIVYWLAKAEQVAEQPQKDVITKLISYYRSGDLKTFDDYSVAWVQDTVTRVDFINGFIENYGDPLGYKASWESVVNFKDGEATKRTGIISENAQWFEDHSPIQDKFKKEEVKGVTAKVINATMLGGDCYPAPPIGINLPNADWIRAEYGSKSVTIQNITEADSEASKGNGFLGEFMLREADRERFALYGTLAGNLHTDLHECLGHGSGKLAPGVSRDALKQYSSVIEEMRADLFALYYIADDKMIELGVVPNREVGRAEYANYVMNGMMTQLARIEYGKNVEQTHMRNRKTIGEWAYEMGRKDNVIEKVVEDGKTYIVVNDFDKLRDIFGRQLREVQRIKSEGDFRAAENLVEKYGIKIEPAFHREILDRYAALGIQPYRGFINPVYSPVMENGEIVDVVIGYQDDYVRQMLDYSSNFSYLPSKN